MFRDYISTFTEIKNKPECRGNGKDKIKAATGMDVTDFESVYEYHQEREKGDLLAKIRYKGELEWYRNKRPYFNVYPVIERKFMEMSLDVQMSELSLPFPTIEIRTQSMTFLMYDAAISFMFVLELGDGVYHEWVTSKQSTLESVIDRKLIQMPRSSTYCISDKGRVSTKDERTKCTIIGAATCLLSGDKKIFTPVIMNKDRKHDMTPAEMAKYAEKAIKRTGRIGYDVGRDIERMKAVEHYRNGCFAKYYVAKGHECYPMGASESKVAIIKWRSGSVVNKGNVPRVPTGFKDLQAVSAD